MNSDSDPQARYRNTFSPAPKQGTTGAVALEFALDVRKFEIELYWKRATYFWAFTGAALVGYLTILTGKDVVIETRPNALLLVSCLGLVFSVAWYFVNRASKFWQANWEAHVDLLEDDVMGPIYKTVQKDKSSFWRINASYPFSVTKINQLLSLFVALVFAGLVLVTLNDHFVFTRCKAEWFPTGCVILTCAALLALYFLGQTREEENKVAFRRRTTRVTEFDDG
jgi:hypothetical protein